MTFYDSRLIASEPFPFIVYVHSGGFEEVFQGNVEEAFGYVQQKINVITETILEGRLTPRDPKYIIATVWGDTYRIKPQTIDTFVFGDIVNWPDNACFAAAVFRPRGMELQRKGRNIKGCEDSLIMLGIEGEVRRRTESLAEYLSQKVRADIMDELSEKGLLVPYQRRQQ